MKDIKVSTIYSGIKKTRNYEDDLLLIELKKKSAIAGVFTQSLTSSPSVNQCKKNLTKYKEPEVRAILVNSEGISPSILIPARSNFVNLDSAVISGIVPFRALFRRLISTKWNTMTATTAATIPMQNVTFQPQCQILIHF